MNGKIDVRGNQLYVKCEGDDSLPAIVFLHGFTGSSETWHEVTRELNGQYRTVAVDLTGHGQSFVPEDHSRYTMEEQIADLDALFVKLNLTNFNLVGYSMGGRIALAYLINHPEKVTSLILESASPGLKTELERINREVADKILSKRIVDEGIPAFVEFWEELALFETQKKLLPEIQDAIRRERLNQSVTGLANSLLAIGTGSQPSYWNQLQYIERPVFLLTGEKDKKFVNIAREMEKCIPEVVHTTISNAGHAIHVEKSSLFATMVRKHLSTVIKNRG